MEKMKKYAKPILKWTIIIMTYFLLMLILGFTGIAKLKTISVLNTIFIAAFLLILGIKSGKKTSKKGFLEGLKLGSLLVAGLFFINLVLYRKFNLFIFTNYLIMIASPTIGGMIGINLKH